ncbi:hypothetical protein JTB14_035267 [Gonioctena quinquepunctata]|nr:hypothetical protein JTB14_035267 [Gonioctena quinquepunctata]
MKNPLYGNDPPASRLKSGNNFMKSTNPLTDTKPATKEAIWKQRLTDNSTPTWSPIESLPAGSQLDWKTWKNFNRIRCHMGMSGDNLLRWKYVENDPCACGTTQTMEHVMTCPFLQTPCTIYDLWRANDAAAVCQILEGDMSHSIVPIISCDALNVVHIKCILLIIFMNKCSSDTINWMN